MNFGRQESLGRFVVGEIPEYLMCPVCLGLLDNASQGVCGHVFCRSCIEGIFNNNSSSNACPLCRSTLLRQSIGPNRIAQMLVDKLQVNCPVEDTETGERCEWAGEKGALLAHHYGGECTLLRQIIERTPVPVIRHSSTANYELIPSRLTVYAASHDVCGGGTGREYVRNLASAGTDDNEHRKVRIRVQKRNGRQSITTIQGLADDLDLQHITKAMKKSFQCCGTIIIDPDLGKIIQLQGDQRIKARDFFIDQEVCSEEQILIAGA